jgi:hypothetical protein
VLRHDAEALEMPATHVKPTDEVAMVRELFPTVPSPAHIDALQWHHAQLRARLSCARVFREGGHPADALLQFDVKLDDTRRLGWARAVEAITETLCQLPVKLAA